MKDILIVYDKNIEAVLAVGYNDWNYYSATDDFKGKAVHYDRYAFKREVNGIKLNFKRLDRGNRYKLRFWYKHDLYEVYYGYGIDTNTKYCYGFSPRLISKFETWLKEAMSYE